MEIIKMIILLSGNYIFDPTFLIKSHLYVHINILHFYLLLKNKCFYLRFMI